MNAFTEHHVAVKAIRVLLIKSGLTEEEADSFLDRIADEFAEGQLEAEDARLKAIQCALADIREHQRTTPGRAEMALTGLATGVVGSLVAAKLYDAFKSEPTIIPPAPPVLTPGDSRTTIQIEWAAGSVKIDTAKQIAGMRRALRWHEQHYGTIDNGTAISLDGLGMFLDAEGRHGEAFRLRRQALKITQRIHGPVSESTGAALSNIGLTLFAQGRYDDSNQYLAKSLRTMIDSLGTNHISTAAAVYNCYFCLRAQGRLRHSVLPQQFLRSLPQIREIANSMTARKYAIVLLMMLLDCARALTEALGVPWVSE
jgi:tetratricopeptide (TPR) repeat protein